MTFLVLSCVPVIKTFWQPVSLKRFAQVSKDRSKSSSSSEVALILRNSLMS